MTDQHRATEIEDRMIDLGVRIIRLTQAMPRSYAARHLARQVLRSGTSPAPNYAEARSAESKADFLHKLRIVLKELNETRIWLTMISRADLIPVDRIASLLDEVEQLSRIIQASVNTLRRQPSARHRDDASINEQ